MNINDIVNYRLINQQLVGTKLTTPKQLVGHFGAMQAQDYAMAKYAIGVRLSVTDKEVENAIDKGDIIRTHVLRPTWHFAAAEDIGWMLKLTAPHVKVTFTSIGRKLELDSKVFNKCNTIIEKSLANGEHLTREEIMLVLNKKGVATDDFRSALIMMNAELDGLVYNGKRRGKQFTYSLLDKKVSGAKQFTKEEALAELAKRYFTSHGPATLHDFAWWSGLSITNSRAALESVKSRLQEEKVGEKVYWFADSSSYKNKAGNSILFLPAFDEFMVSYKDRSASLNPLMTKQTITNNGIFKPIIIVNGKVVGLWRRTVKKDRVLIETELFKEISKPQKQSIDKTAKQYGEFMEMKVVAT